MLSHVSVGVTDFDLALVFYGPLMSVLSIKQRFCERDRSWAGWQSESVARPLFIIAHPHNGQAPTPGNGTMVAFLAATRGCSLNTMRIDTGPISGSPMATNYVWSAMSLNRRPDPRRVHGRRATNSAAITTVQQKLATGFTVVLALINHAAQHRKQTRHALHQSRMIV
ncbi:MAG TPA: hypothetical protein VIM63_02090 [Rhodoferax sp.]